MIDYTANKYGFKLNSFEISESKEEQKLLHEKLVYETSKWMKETEDSWLDRQLTLFFSKDFDLYWAYDCYMKDKDWVGLQKMLEDHELRICKQSGKVSNGSYLTYLFHGGSKLLGTLEIKLLGEDNMFNYQVIVK